MSATFTHLFLFNRSDLSSAWTWLTPSALKEAWADFDWKFWQHDGRAERLKLYEETSPEALKARGLDPHSASIDPHYREMLKYADAPNSWYFITLVLSTLVSLVVIYKANSTLPWWGFLISIALATISILFFGILYAITGFGLSVQSFVQMVGGFREHQCSLCNLITLIIPKQFILESLWLTCTLCYTLTVSHP